MPNLLYTLATEADIPVIIDYRIRFLTEFWGVHPQEEVDNLRTHFEQYFATAFRDGSFISWLAKDVDIVAGMGAMTIRHQPGNFKNPSGTVGYLLNMYTLPAYRRQGICSNILTRLLATGREMGITTFDLFASKQGEPVYVKHGFKLHPEPAYRKHMQ